MIAKKGTVQPTSLTYAQALDEALCSGWIDGQRKGRDAATFLKRFTPRRPGSIWSKRNVTLVERLISKGRMRPLGMAQIDTAQRDGRWERSYAGSATLETPQDVAAALAASPTAAARFEQLNAGDQYPLLLGLSQQPRRCACAGSPRWSIAWSTKHDEVENDDARHGAHRHRDFALPCLMTSL